ncbi:uncharacterized protein PV07_10167 [Cladophialophora immunda]|uniref:Uncharacterized protein n=1 Tax=Cladophialophora immunda TaxID=569365 RepID=A0A0D2C1Z6_9EURO|nr:uncharacterized protein PV07_10167 [Cladophialophora immunda]KIW24455.1 hypothetical protein PV07_10167 [Cladophialophora immunda]OQV02653.1 hypothetical protein CLAIMM_07810 [Cladophialophora immunda]
MPPVATEIAQFNLILGQDPRNPGSSAAQFLQKVFDIVKQREGFIRGYWGIQDQNPGILVVIVDWEDIKHHQDLVNSEDFAAMTENLVNLVTFENGPPVVTHVNFTSDAASACQSSVTAVKSFRLPEDASEKQKSALEDSFLSLVKVYTTETPCSGYACGWVLETLPDDNAPGDEALTFTGIFGWPAKEGPESSRDNSGDPALVAAVEQILRLALPQKKGDAFDVSLRSFG